MDEILDAALSPVLRDLAGADPTVRVRLRDEEWSGDPGRPAAMLRGPGGTGAGVAVFRDDPPGLRVADAAEQVQEWAVKELAAVGASNWPVCPAHPGTHPLRAGLRAGQAWWECPHTGDGVAVVGELGDRR
ncbi:hypothetical protein [Pseudonocardia sp. ICBG601]|uniref:hypothetical protein n=1 Tax=Pseudonocardia sp. ICBG601 TaxID=2846759 RepID=UPI001CF6F7A9|nr:hypothetical protein [Pseudonocardia sp. ICBG601]